MPEARELKIQAIVEALRGVPIDPGKQEQLVNPGEDGAWEMRDTTVGDLLPNTWLSDRPMGPPWDQPDPWTESFLRRAAEAALHVIEHGNY